MTDAEALGPNPDRIRARVAVVLDALLAQADKGDLEAAQSAVRLAAGQDPSRAAHALEIALRLDPRDDQARLSLSRLRAGRGDLEAARREAEAVFAHAIDEAVRAQAALALGDIARLQGEWDAARAAYEATIEAEAAILAADPSEPTALRWHARAVGRIADIDAVEGDLERARGQAEGALAMLKALSAQIGEAPALAADIGDAELRLAELDLAEDAPQAMRPHLAQAISRYEALAVLEKDEPHWRDRLAQCWALTAEAHGAERDAPAARAAIDKAVSQRIWLANHAPEERWGLAAIWRVRAGLLASLGDMPHAAESLAQAVSLTEALCADAQDAEPEARFLLRTRLEQADLALRMGEVKLARDAADRARADAERFAQKDPSWTGDLAQAWERLGEIAKTVAAAEHAEDAYCRAVELRRMQQAESDSPSLKRALAAALLKSGEAALAMRGVKSARAAFAEAFALRLELAELYEGMLEPARDLAVALERLGMAAAAEGDAAGARAAWEQELALVERIYSVNDPAGVRFAAIIEAQLSDLRGPDCERYRQSARVRMAHLATLTTLTLEDAALIERLGSDF